MEMSRQIHAPDTVLPAKDLPAPCCIGGRVGSRGHLDTLGEKNLLPLRGIERRFFDRQCCSAVAIVLTMTWRVVTYYESYDKGAHSS